MARKIIPLHFFDSKVPLVSFGFEDGEVLYAIIDTGAEHTVLGENLMDRIEMFGEDVNTVVVGINGKDESRTFRQGVCRIFLNVQSKKKVKAFIVGMVNNLDHISGHFKNENGDIVRVSAIIGGDFLSYYNATIDYKEEIITISSNHD